MNKKIKTELAIGTILSVAIIVGGLIWLDAKKEEKSLAVETSLKQNSQSVNTQTSKLDCPENDPYRYCFTRPDGTKVLVQLDPKYVQIIKPNDTFYKAGFDDSIAGIIRGCLPQKYLDVIDFTTFEFVTAPNVPKNSKFSCFAKDKSKVYWAASCGQDCMLNTELSAADPRTFQMIGDSSYAKDKINVYFIRSTNGNPEISNADLKSFEVLSSFFAEDNKNIYFGDFKINADVATFKVVDSSMSKAEDKNNSYKCIYGNVVCGTSCDITNLKTGKKSTIYLDDRKRDPMCDSN